MVSMWAETGDGDTVEEKSGRREETESDQVSGGQWLRSFQSVDQEVHELSMLRKMLRGCLSDYRLLSSHLEISLVAIVTSISFFVSVLPSERIIPAVSLPVLC